MIGKNAHALANVERKRKKTRHNKTFSMMDAYCFLYTCIIIEFSCLSHMIITSIDFTDSYIQINGICIHIFMPGLLAFTTFLFERLYISSWIFNFTFHLKLNINLLKKRKNISSRIIAINSIYHYCWLYLQWCNFFNCLGFFFPKFRFNWKWIW